MEYTVKPIQQTAKVRDFILKYYADANASHDAGKLVAWCSTQSPFEIVKSMGITCVFPEGYGAVCAMFGASTLNCERADALGYSPDLCSVVRNFIGAESGTPEAERASLPFGGLPKPDVLICQSYCPGIYKMFERYARQYNVPYVAIERPRIHDGLTKDEIRGLIMNGVEELKRVIETLEGLTGKKLDMDELQTSLAIEREVANTWFEILAMGKHVPSPLSTMDEFNNVFPFYMYRCDQVAVDYYKELKAELDDRVKNGIIPYEGGEKYRLYWDIASLPHKDPLIQEKFSSFGAVPVVGMFPYYFGHRDIDPTRPLEQVIEIMYMHPSNLGVQRREKHLIDQLKGFSLDGLVMQKHRTCQVVMLHSGDLDEAVVKASGLPSVVVEGDPCDSRFFSDSDFFGKIDALRDMLANRKPEDRW